MSAGDCLCQEERKNFQKSGGGIQISHLMPRLFQFIQVLLSLFSILSCFLRKKLDLFGNLCIKKHMHLDFVCFVMVFYVLLFMLTFNMIS
jgi:hypothetical protein